MAAQGIAAASFTASQERYSEEPSAVTGEKGRRVPKLKLDEFFGDLSEFAFEGYK